MTTLHLLRHLPALGAEGRAVGHADLPLADESLAERLAEAYPLGRPDRLFTSPLARARQTAAPLAAEWGLDATPAPALAEMDFGRWDGRTWADVEQTDSAALGAWMADWTATPAPGGESFADVQARVEAWLDALPEGETVAVAHAGSVRAVLVRVLGLDPAHAFRLAVRHGALTTVRLGPGPELLVLNRPLLP